MTGKLVTDLPRLDTTPPAAALLKQNLANKGISLELCDHDWRVDDSVILQSGWPQQYVICALCGVYATRRIPNRGSG